MARRRPLVVGVGNDDRGDDGVGLDVARSLLSRNGLEADVRLWPGELTGLFELWRDRTQVVVVDAVRSGAPSGTIHRVDVGAGRPLPLPAAFSTHGLSLGSVVELGRTLGVLPPRLVLYGVEAGDVAVGGRRSTAVAQAVEEVSARIFEELGPGPPRAGPGREGVRAPRA